MFRLRVLLCLTLGSLVGACSQQKPPPAPAPAPAPQSVRIEPVDFDDPQEDALAAFRSGQAPGPGHSHHGTVFDEGPKRAAELFIPPAERVHFSLQGCSPAASPYFDQGVTLLHAFWVYEAERSFRQVAKIDPTCAMAYWGLSMSQTIFGAGSRKRAAKFIAIANDLGKDDSPRNRLYIESLVELYRRDLPDNHSRKLSALKKMKALMDRFPDDIEAKAFFVELAWESQLAGELSYSEADLDQLIEEVLFKNPLHPVHHYRIHLWDEPERAGKALASARLNGLALPESPHMWHMPAHIYSDLKMWDEAAWSTEASHRRDQLSLGRSPEKALPYFIHNYYHHADFYFLALLATGQGHKALEQAKNFVEIPKHPLYNNPYDFSQYWAPQEFLYFYKAITLFELWKDARALSTTPYLDEKQALEPMELRRLKVLALAALKAGDGERAEKLWTEAQALPAEIEKNSGYKDDKDRQTVKESVETLLKDFRLCLDLAKPGPFVREKFEELRKLTETSGDALALWVLEKSGPLAYAEELAREATETADKRWVSKLVPRANLAFVLYRSGKKAEAKTEMEKILPLLAQAELGLAPFARLEPAARELFNGKSLAELRPTFKPRPELPELETLGSLYWEPSNAPSLFFGSERRKSYRADDIMGSGMKLVVFYLGEACSRCATQLQQLSEKAESFKKAGISINVITPEEDISKFEKQNLPLAVVSDPKLRIFKDYSVYDDFEEQPLHGVFLIDADAKIRWQDVSATAFLDLDFLLREGRRLERLPNHHESKDILASE